MGDVQPTYWGLNEVGFVPAILFHGRKFQFATMILNSKPINNG